MGSGDQKERRFRRLIEEMKPPPWSQDGPRAYVGRVGRDDKWAVVLDFVALEGGLYCYSVRVEPDGLRSMKSTDELPVGGVTSRVLSSIKLEGIFRSLGIAERALRASFPEDEARPAPARPRRGRPPKDDAHYREIALLYLEAMRAEPRRPIEWMAAKNGHASSTVRGWVSEARKRGFLSPGQRGKGGAVPGPRLTGGNIEWSTLLDEDDSAQA